MTAAEYLRTRSVLQHISEEEGGAGYGLYAPKTPSTSLPPTFDGIYHARFHQIYLITWVSATTFDKIQRELAWRGLRSREIPELGHLAGQVLMIVEHIVSYGDIAHFAMPCPLSDEVGLFPLFPRPLVSVVHQLD